MSGAHNETPSECYLLSISTELQNSQQVASLVGFWQLFSKVLAHWFCHRERENVLSVFIFYLCGAADKYLIAHNTKKLDQGINVNRD